MKLQSTEWKNRTIHLPHVSNAQFDADGICEVEITDDQAKYLTTNIKHLTVVAEEGKPKKAKKKEEVIEGTAPVVGEEKIAENASELTAEQNAEKQSAIDNINSVKGLKALKELAESFPSEEWSHLTKVVDLKNYLISKL